MESGAEKGNGSRVSAAHTFKGLNALTLFPTKEGGLANMRDLHAM